MDTGEQAEFGVVICAAGSSSRMGGLKKEYRLLPAVSGAAPGTVLGAAVSAFAAFSCIGAIVITVPDDDGSEAQARAALPPDLSGRFLFVRGGNSRRLSVHKGLERLSQYNPRYVLIHDGCRPWVSAALIARVIDAARKHQAAVPLLPLVETPKETEKPLALKDADSFADAPVFVTRHLKRPNTSGAQTPQGFVFSEILTAHKKAARTADAEFTDDAEVWGTFCGPVAAVPGSAENRKITFPEDLV